jgi:OOP family OmpA-OmpF porin
MSKRASFLISAILVQALVASPSVFAQDESAKLSVTPFVGGYTFDGAQYLKTEPVYGLRVGYSLNKWWDVEGVFDYVSTESKDGNGDASAYNYRVEGLYNIMPGERFIPFLAAGVGGNTVDYPEPTGHGTVTRAVLDYGAGLKYFVSESWAVRADVRHLLVFDKTNRVLGNLEYAIGLNYLFGKSAPAPEMDSDGDGVMDDMDKCPDTPRGASVDSDGCPLDSDGDGVFDYKDKCPDTPKGVVVDRNGCPLDSDGDGVTDDKDKCPDTPRGATVDMDGCPLDSDGDGVLDYMDKCPDTPRGVEVDRNGCPLDSDGDGVLDYKDKCPDTPRGATVDMDGCPLDTDGDGVLDYMDKCPGTPKGLTVDKNGCPPVIEKKSMRLNVEFDTGKADIKPEYNDEIKKVADLLAAYPDISIEIAGHTDNVGSAKLNKALSQRRADSVKKYLVEKFGISSSRLTAVGYGPARPVADNSTRDGRQKNRRIEAVVNYTVTK